MEEKAFMLLDLSRKTIIKEVTILRDSAFDLSVPAGVTHIRYFEGGGKYTRWVLKENLYATREEANFVLSLRGITSEE